MLFNRKRYAGLLWTKPDAYDKIDTTYLVQRLQAFLPRIHIRLSTPPKWSFAQDLLTHYYVLKPEDYTEIMQ